jgi:hypothetical protein
MRELAVAPPPVQWDAGMVAELARLWVSGYSTSVMAKSLGISRSSVAGKLKSLRVDALVRAHRERA